MKKDTDAMVWGTLREKGFLRDMTKKRFGQERLDFLLKYKKSLSLREKWCGLDRRSITSYVDRLIRDCQSNAEGVFSDNSRL